MQFVKRIKNNTETEKTWAGQSVQPGAYYQIQGVEEIRWANDDEVMTSITAGEIIVNDGIDDIPDVNDGIDWIKNQTPPLVRLADGENQALQGAITSDTNRFKVDSAISAWPSTSLGTIETEHQRIHNGTAYSACTIFTLANDEIKRFEVNVVTKNMHFLPLILCTGQIQYKLYEQPISPTSSTGYPFMNRNRTSANTTSSTFKLLTGYCALGDLIHGIKYGNPSGGNNSTTLNSRSREFILKAGFKYIIEVRSFNSGNSVSICLDMYETS